MKNIALKIWKYLAFALIFALVYTEGGWQSLAYFATWVVMVVDLLAVGVLYAFFSLFAGVVLYQVWTDGWPDKRIEYKTSDVKPKWHVPVLQVGLAGFAAYHGYIGIATALLTCVVGIVGLVLAIKKFEKFIKEHNAKYPE